MPISLSSVRKLFLIFIFLKLWISIPIAFALTSEAEGAQNRPALKTDQKLKITYGYPSQNRDSTKIEQVRILLRDNESGHLATLEMDETAPDSSTFSGNFSVRWGDVQAITPDIYIPDQELFDEKNGLEKITTSVQAKKLKRKAFVFRSENGKYLVDLYDTREQAEAAHEAFKKQSAPAVAETTVTSLKKNPAAAVLDAAQLAKEEAARQEAQQKAAQQELERVRLEQLEKQKALERQQAAEKLRQEEIAQRKKEALAAAQQALAHYRKGEFKAARDLFEKSVSLDPTNSTYYYQFGITLFKTDDFNRSVVLLNMAEGKEINPFEKDYYLGLNYFRLNEMELALKHFRAVKKANDKVLAPSAAFYEGIILFGQHQYEPSRDAFQFVLDTSEDPRLDEKAEEYIEQIARILQFAANKAKTFLVGATLGATYDNNILLLSDSSLQQDSASDEAGLQGLLQTSLEWRPIFEKQHEWSTKLSYLQTMTWNPSLQIVDALRTGDAQVSSLSFPYVYKGMVWGKGYKLAVTPSYEAVAMDPVAGTTPTNILNSGIMAVSNTFVMNDLWFSVYDLELRRDNSALSTTTDADRASAYKYTVKTTQLFFLEKKRERGIIGDLAYSMNSADGANNNFNKIDLGVSYLMPLNFYEVGLLTRVGYALLSYPDKSTPRNDRTTSLTVNLTRKMSDWMGIALSLGYTSNDSNTNQYNKLSVGTSASFNTDF